LPAIRATNDVEFLQAYVTWSRGKRAASLHWAASDTADVEADLTANEAVLVKTNYDRGWHAPLAATQPDPIGFLLLQLPTGPHHTRLTFGAAWDVWVGRAVFLATVLLLLLRARPWLTAVTATVPVLLAYAILAHSVPPTVAVAADAFRRIQPPMISPEGIVRQGDAVALYGEFFGQANDQVTVWVAGEPAKILYRGPNQVNVQLPSGIPRNAEISVEVNGCRGNAFMAIAR
jgi:hypothetical protein